MDWLTPRILKHFQKHSFPAPSHYNNLREHKLGRPEQSHHHESKRNRFSDPTSQSRRSESNASDADITHGSHGTHGHVIPSGSSRDFTDSHVNDLSSLPHHGIFHRDRQPCVNNNHDNILAFNSNIHAQKHISSNRTDHTSHMCTGHHDHDHHHVHVSKMKNVNVKTQVKTCSREGKEYVNDQLIRLRVVMAMGLSMFHVLGIYCIYYFLLQLSWTS